MVDIPDRIGVVLVDTFGVPYKVTSSGGVSQADNSAFVAGTDSGAPVMFIVDDTATSAVTENSVGVPRMTTDRIIMVGGNIAHDSPDSGNPVKIGGVANSTAPTSVTAGDRANLWLGLQGQVNVGFPANGSGGDGVNGGFFTDTSGNARPLVVGVWNGTNFDRLRGTLAGGLSVSGTGTAGTAASGVATIQGIASMTPVQVGDNSASLSVDWNGTQPVTGSGNATGALRVELANNGTGLLSAAQSGTWTVQPGNTPNTSAWLTQNTPATSGGLTTFMASGSDGSSILVATAQAIKASAGQLYGYYAYNPEAAVTFVHFYNTAAASVTVGTTNPLFTLAIPAGAAANLMSDTGIVFSNAGWSCAATTTAGGNTAPATGVSLVAWYK